MIYYTIAALIIWLAVGAFGYISWQHSKHKEIK